MQNRNIFARVLPYNEHVFLDFFLLLRRKHILREKRLYFLNNSCFFNLNVSLHF